MARRWRRAVGAVVGGVAVGVLAVALPAGGHDADPLPASRCDEPGLPPVPGPCTTK